MTATRPDPPACRVCGHAEGNTRLVAREMMFGTGGAFPYVECAGCGCVQIERVPDDLARHYPPDYYAFSPAGPAPGWRRRLQRRRADHLFGGRDVLGALLAAVFGTPPTIAYARRAGVDRGARVLEVGCGGGERLVAMRDYGFDHLVGIDPFLPRSFEPVPGVRVRAESIHDHEGEYDLIMLHHVFEHMDDPTGSLRRLRVLLAPGGVILLRLPLASSYAFRTYREHWVQLDAPRHLHLHTRASLERAAGDAGLAVASIRHDSTAFQFWGSEQVRRGIPLRDPRSYAVDPRRSPFGRREIRAFEAAARRLNRLGDGDQAAVYLRAADVQRSRQSS